MDVESYETLYKRIKDSLIYSFDMSQNVFIASHISSALEECNSCVSKSLKLATKLLEETNFQVNKLCDYIDNAIILLQMLSDFIKNVLESAAMACRNMKPFPTTTGNIILTVFMHCKDSAWIYGNHLTSVERQLKDLFRTCHELQLTYLMTLEKHFIFDLSEKEEQDILIEALNINMRIGEIVQALDIKTMAEQWKGYTVICEKYSNFLLDKNICNKCFHIFATIIMDNIKISLEPDQNNKSVLRSLKVANFTIKILSRISNVFKHAVTNNYEHVVELMGYVYLHNPAFLEQSGENSQQFINLMLTNILNPTDGLCNILLDDERFLDYIYKIDVNKLDTNTSLGYIILITSIIKTMLQKKEDQMLSFSKHKLIDCVYRILPLGHFWFNMDLRFQSKDSSGNENDFSLYEHLLVHVVALATTFNPEQYALLERCMYEAIMTTDCYSALFSTNLWVLLVRTSTDHLASSTLSSLINVYQKLEKYTAFHNSPQQVHLSYTIGKLFEVSSSEDKRQMSKQIRPQNALWSLLKVSNLPDPLRRIEAGVLENFQISCQELFESEDISEKGVESLIQIMKVTATCSSLETDDVIKQYIVKLWSKVCRKNQSIEYIRSEDCGATDTVWYFRYLDAVVTLTYCVRPKLDSASVGQILHNMSTLLYHCGTEITVLIFDLFCKLTFTRVEDENRYVIDNIFKNTLKVLLQIENVFTKQFLQNTLSEYTYDEQFDNIASVLLYDEGKEFDINFKSTSKSVEWKQELLSVARFEYIHRCVRIPSDDRKGRSERIIRSTTSNFDIGDFLFDDESEEPSRKKAKLDLNETDSLVERLENDTLLLCQVEDSALHNYKKRIADVIDKLRNRVS